MESSTYLDVKDLVSGYFGSRIVDGASLGVRRGEVVAILGRNGAGKSTFINTLIGWVKPAAGAITLNGTDIAGMRPEAIARHGVALVPQGRRVIAELTVLDNLVIAAPSAKGVEPRLERVYDLFPRLKARLKNHGNELSGGEQQMVAIGRALMRDPELLLMDEPSDGLAPTVIADITTAIEQLIAGGITVVLVEQDLRLAFAVADRIAVMQKGAFILDTDVDDFRSNAPRAKRLLGLSE